MEIILISIICASGYLIICAKILGLQRLKHYQVFLDIAFTLLLPVLFLGTFSGMATAFLSGVFFSIATAFLSLLVPTPKHQKKEVGKLIEL